jgi:hypothetical protein
METVLSGFVTETKKASIINIRWNDSDIIKITKPKRNLLTRLFVPAQIFEVKGLLPAVGSRVNVLMPDMDKVVLLHSLVNGVKRDNEVTELLKQQLTKIIDIQTLLSNYLNCPPNTMPETVRYKDKNSIVGEMRILQIGKAGQTAVEVLDSTQDQYNGQKWWVENNSIELLYCRHIDKLSENDYHQSCKKFDTRFVRL